MKMQQTLGKIKFTTEEINYKQTHIPVAISLLWYKIEVFITHLLVWTIDITYFWLCHLEYGDVCG